MQHLLMRGLRSMSDWRPFEPEIENVFQANFLISGSRFGIVNIEKIRFPSYHTCFLEHCSRDPIHSPEQSGEVIAAGPDDIFFSQDLGQTWRARETSAKYSNCFTLASGERLLYAPEHRSIHLTTPGFDLLHSVEVGKAPWHGTWGIDQSKSGVIAWGEYLDSAESLSVFHSEDGGKNWSEVFAMEGHPTSAKLGQIRHWHVCRSNPHLPNCWILASGDAVSQCRLFVSYDDAATWDQIEPNFTNASNFSIPPHLYAKLLRFVSPHFLSPTTFIYTTDDNLDGFGALLVKVDLSTASLTILGKVGFNESRALIHVGESQWIAISESKLDRRWAEVFYIDHESIHHICNIPNKDELKSNFPNSFCSPRSINNFFFTQNDGVFFRPSSRILRWSVQLHQSPKTSLSRDSKENVVMEPPAEKQMTEENLAPLHFLNVTEADVRRWDLEWIRYFRKPEAQTYFREHNDADPNLAVVREATSGADRRQVFRAPGIVSKKLLLWYESKDLLDKKVAEIGCGVGRVGRDVCSIVAEYVGLDYSELALYVATCVGAPNCSFVSLRNKERIAALRGSRDTVIFRNFFIHQPIENVAWLLELAHYLLKDGGVTVLDFYWPNADHERRVDEGRTALAEQGKQDFPSTLYVFQDDTIRRLIEEHHFELVDDHIMEVPPRRFYRIEKKSG